MRWRNFTLVISVRVVVNGGRGCRDAVVRSNKMNCGLVGIDRACSARKPGTL